MRPGMPVAALGEGHLIFVVKSLLLFFYKFSVYYLENLDNYKRNIKKIFFFTLRLKSVEVHLGFCGV